MQKPMIPFFNNDKKKNLKVCDCGEAYIYLPRHWGHRLWNDEVKPCIFLLKRRWDLASSYQRCLCPCLHLVEPAHSSNKYVYRMWVYIATRVINVSLYIFVSKKKGSRSCDGNANLNDRGMVLSCEVISPFVENLMLLIQASDKPIINFSLLKSMLYLGFHASIHHLITYLKLIISGFTNPYMLTKKHLIRNFHQLIKFILIYLFWYVGKIH